jgi:hypothetical protein
VGARADAAIPDGADATEDRPQPIEHIYVKIGASSRATASLFAMQHGLLSDEHLANA